MARNAIGIILAAGCSTRMGADNKLTSIWRGKPLICHVVEAAALSQLASFVVVTGHQSGMIAAALDENTPVLHNPNYKTGMASSLNTGIRHAQVVGANAALVLLGDMPLVTPGHINRILETDREAMGQSIVQATCDGYPGNPVLFPSDLFEDLLQVTGDQGAREVVSNNRNRLVQLEIGEAAKRDFDTPEAFADHAD